MTAKPIPNGYRPFTHREDRVLVREWHKLTATVDIANLIHRDVGSIRGRATVLGLPARDGKSMPRPHKSSISIGEEDPLPGDEIDGRPKCPGNDALAEAMKGFTFSDRKRIQPQATIHACGRRYADDHTVGGVAL